LPGLHLAGPGTALAAGAVLGLVNVLVKPVLIILTLPLTLVTLGLFLFVVNALCLRLTAAIIPGFAVDGFWWSILGALVVSVVSWILNGLCCPRQTTGAIARSCEDTDARGVRRKLHASATRAP
jgi:putative membrane protein